MLDLSLLQHRFTPAAHSTLGGCTLLSRQQHLVARYASGKAAVVVLFLVHQGSPQFDATGNLNASCCMESMMLCQVTDLPLPASAWKGGQAQPWKVDSIAPAVSIHSSLAGPSQVNMPVRILPLPPLRIAAIKIWHGAKNATKLFPDTLHAELNAATTNI